MWCAPGAPRSRRSRSAVAAAVAVGLALVSSFALSQEPPRFEFHYSPSENLEKIDVELIDAAETSLDVAAYVLTDYSVVQAIGAAAVRGVKIRLYLDGSQFRDNRYPEGHPYWALMDLENVAIKIKPAGQPIMHQKAFAIDGILLRTGSANFSSSGLKKQDNDLVIIRDPAVVAGFERNFEIEWAR